MATPILPRNRQPRPPGRNTPLKIHKGLLENRRDANGQALLQVSVVGNIDRNETSVSNSWLHILTQVTREALRSITCRRHWPAIQCRSRYLAQFGSSIITRSCIPAIDGWTLRHTFTRHKPSPKYVLQPCSTTTIHITWTSPTRCGLIT